MRKFALIICLCCSLYSIGQVRIAMEKTLGVYKVPCMVNGAKMKFVFDTGAAYVTLSKPMAEYLFENNYLSQNDIIGTQQLQDATGKISTHVTVNIKDIEIGGKHIQNVTASIVGSQNAPLLLGQSAIQKLGKVSIEDNFLIIGDPETAKIINKMGSDEIIGKDLLFYVEECDTCVMDTTTSSFTNNIAYKDCFETFNHGVQVKEFIGIPFFLDLPTTAINVYKKHHQILSKIYYNTYYLDGIYFAGTTFDRAYLYFNYSGEIKQLFCSSRLIKNYSKNIKAAKNKIEDLALALQKIYGNKTIAKDEFGYNAYFFGEPVYYGDATPFYPICVSILKEEYQQSANYSVVIEYFVNNRYVLQTNIESQ